MTKVFLKKGEVKLINGGYVVDGNDNPVTNVAFIEAQKQAEYVVTFAKLAKGKTFTDKKGYSLETLKQDVNNALASKQKEFVAAPKKPANTMTKKLADEAMAFVSYDKDVNNAAKVNKFLAKFNIIDEFEEFGLFFDQDIVKLNNIYTMEEIVSAVNSTIELLD